MKETLIHSFMEYPVCLELAFGHKWSVRLNDWHISNMMDLFNVCFVPLFSS